MNRLPELQQYLRTLAPDGIALAFSGGVDSSFLLALLKELHQENPFPLFALTMQTVFQSDEEIRETRELSRESGVPLKLFSCDPLSLPEIRNNPPDRCYWCKRFIFNQFTVFCREHNIRNLLDGTNADDLHVYRPGRRALAELGVISPLAEFGFTKAEIRKCAAERGLHCHAKPSMPCLATRFEYGIRLTPERIAQAGKGEALLRKHVPEAADVRLRVHGKMARIEVSPEALAGVLEKRKQIAAELHLLGFEFVTLDLEGYRSGCFDQGKTFTETEV